MFDEAIKFIVNNLTTFENNGQSYDVYTDCAMWMVDPREKSDRCGFTNLNNGRISLITILTMKLRHKL